MTRRDENLGTRVESQMRRVAGAGNGGLGIGERVGSRARVLAMGDRSGGLVFGPDERRVDGDHSLSAGKRGR